MSILCDSDFTWSWGRLLHGALAQLTDTPQSHLTLGKTVQWAINPNWLQWLTDITKLTAQQLPWPVATLRSQHCHYIDLTTLCTITTTLGMLLFTVLSHWLCLNNNCNRKSQPNLKVVTHKNWNWQSQMFWDVLFTTWHHSRGRSTRNFTKNRVAGHGRLAVWICGQNALFD